MTKYTPYDHSQSQFIPIFFDKRIQQGTFEYTLSYLIDKKLDLFIFDDCFHDDETGASVNDPRILLKVILLACSGSIAFGRKIGKEQTTVCQYPLCSRFDPIYPAS